MGGHNVLVGVPNVALLKELPIGPLVIHKKGVDDDVGMINSTDVANGAWGGCGTLIGRAPQVVSTLVFGPIPKAPSFVGHRTILAMYGEVGDWPELHELIGSNV